MCRIWQISACVAALTVTSAVSLGQVTGLSLTQRSVTSLGNSTTDQNGQSFTIAGLSGLTYAGGNTFWAVMDNSNKLVHLNVTFGANGSIASANITGGLSLQHARDYEGIALAQDGASVYVSTENPLEVRQYRLSDGAYLQSLPVPAVYQNHRAWFGLESLSRAGSALWTANEEALSVDGDFSRTTSGTVVRLQRFDLNGAGGATAGAQYAYNVEKIHSNVTDANQYGGYNYSRSGLSDLVALPDGRLLALERSFAYADFLGISGLGSSYQTRIYLVDPAGATDVSGLVGLVGETYTPALKSPLWSTGSGIGNLEGLALGPQLPNGNWTVLGIVDSGSSTDFLSANRLVSFELVGTIIPEPGMLSLLAVAGFLVLGRRPVGASHSRRGARMSTGFGRDVEMKNNHQAGQGVL